MVRGLIRSALAAALALGFAVPAAACVKRTPTADDVLGPHDFSTPPSRNELWREGDAGEPLVLQLRVLDTCSRPLPGARVQLLHAGPHGEHRHDRWRTVLTADEQGVVELITVVPGYAGSIARHIHVLIDHPGHSKLITRLYFKNDPEVARFGLDDRALVLEEVRHGGTTRWVSGFEFVLGPPP